MDKPYIAKCNTGACSKIRETFQTEKEQKKWGSEHQMIFGRDHVVHYAMKVSISNK